MTARQRSAFYSQLQRLLQAGVPLRGGLDMLGRHRHAGYAAAMPAVVRALDDGKTLTQGLQQSGLRLPEFHLKLLAVGESSGRLADVIENLRQWDQEQNKLRFELVQPLVYPIVLLLAAVFVTPLPLLVSDDGSAYLQTAMRPLWPALLLVLGVVALYKMAPKPFGRFLDLVPVLSTVRRYLAGSFFLYAFGTALECGLGMPEALEGALQSATSPRLRALAERCRAAALAGRFELSDLADPWHFGHFSSQVLVAAAETGTVGAAALNTARLLREDAVAMARRGIQILAALAYLAAALVVGLTVIRFYTNLYATSGL